MRLTFQQLKMCNSKNYKIFLKWIKVVRALLFPLKLASGANQKKKGKDVGKGNIFKKNRTRVLP